MALFLSDRLTSASGSVGGTTYSHNRNGLYIRARRKGVNPNTPAQQAQRATFGGASAGWRALTQIQRDAWSAYAASSPARNALGQPTTLTGQQAFVASNSLLARLTTDTVTDAPTVPGRIDLGSPTVAATHTGSGTITVANVNSDIPTVGVFLGSPVSAGVLFFAGSYQLVGTGVPAAGTFTVTPAAGRNGLPIVATQRLPWRLAGVDDATGRLTTVASGILIAT